MSNHLDGLPSSIRIGPYDIAIAVKDRINDDDDVGEYNHGQSICLRTNQYNPMFAVDTVLHEVGHALYKCSGLDDGSSEESVITALASGWTQVFRDNPELLSWLYRMMPPR